MRDIQHFIAGQAKAGASGRFGEVFDPNTGEVQAKVALATPAELDAAVQAALRAQGPWAATNPQRRARVMFEFKRLVEARMDELAALLSSEHGKVIADSKGDIQRGLEVIEFACGIPHALKGEYTEGAGPGIDVYSMRQPLGVVAGITPFNFPAMIPMWMFGVAIAVGNTFILKPSEKDPSVPVRLAELFMEAGANLGMDLAGVLILTVQHEQLREDRDDERFRVAKHDLEVVGRRVERDTEHDEPEHHVQDHERAGGEVQHDLIDVHLAAPFVWEGWCSAAVSARTAPR